MGAVHKPNVGPSATKPTCAYHIRPATKRDVHHLPAIEKSAGNLFRSCEDPQLHLLADDEPTDIDGHNENIDGWDSWMVGAGGTWIAVIVPVVTSIAAEDAEEDQEVIVGFIKSQLVRVLDKQQKESDSVGPSDDTDKFFIHIDELSVHSDHQRQGLASKLIDAVKETAQSLHIAAAVCIHDKLHGVQSPVDVIGITLITMQHVVFNRPFYEKLEFESFGADQESIGRVFGKNALQIWSEDLEVFRAKGNGTLAKHRCWMSYLGTSEDKVGGT